MDSCPAELFALILEYIPLVDLGKTARSLGLVSKYCRRAAKPFEFRALVIVGNEQLKAALHKIKTARKRQMDGATIIDVRHLFVREIELDVDLFMENADTDSGESDTYSDESIDEEEKFWEAVDKCRDDANEFRTRTIALVRKVRTTLVTLSIIQRFRDSFCNFEAPCIISGLSFPHLENPIFEHRGDISEFGFVRPTAPLLRRIHLSAVRIHNLPSELDSVGRPEIEDMTLILHPLLVNMHSRFESLTHLVLCGGGIYFVDDLLEMLRGSKTDAMEFKSTLPANRKLPGRLVHTVLKPGYQHDHEGVLLFCKGARALCIDGLEIQEPHYVSYEIGVRERNDEILEEFEGLARERW